MQNSEKGIIFNIEHGSMVDGPGIRTTVFFKGCNMNCAWCHNPESQNPHIEKMFYADKCRNCGLCKTVCKSSECILCGECAKICPTGAISICGREAAIEEIMDEILADKDFYGEEGGVTLSGGECMLQIDFVCELLKKCKANGIHTAIDTAGNIPWSSFERIVAFTDLFLYDIKLADNKKHKLYTGVENELIIENLKKLSKTGKDIIIRVPVIGGVNDNLDEMHGISNILTDMTIQNIELLPYHKMGESKYPAIGKQPVHFSTPSKENISTYKSIINKNCVN